MLLLNGGHYNKKVIWTHSLWKIFLYQIYNWEFKKNGEITKQFQLSRQQLHNQDLHKVELTTVCQYY